MRNWLNIVWWRFYDRFATAEHPIPFAAPDGSVKQLEQDLQLVKSFHAKTLLPCHGGTLEPELLDRTLRYFKILREKNSCTCS